MKKDFEAGQVWRYNTRSGEEDSTATILKIDIVENSLIISVKLDNLKIQKVSEKGSISVVEHIPVSESSFQKSISHLISKIEVDVNEGYNKWYNAYSQNKAGVYSIGLAEIVSLIEATLKDV